MKISIITATWNCEKTIADCLDSVASQSYQNKEHIIVDGNSKDGTLGILNKHRNRLSSIVSEPDNGIYDALNKGIYRSSGDVIGFLHADDVYAHENVLSKLAGIFEDPSISAVYGDLQYVSKKNLNNVVRHWSSSEFDMDKLRKGWMPPHPTLYVRRSWYERIKGFDTQYKISADYMSILTLFSEKDFFSKYIPEVLVKMRIGGSSNKSIINIIRKSIEDYDVLCKSGVGGLESLFYKNINKLCQFFEHRN